MKRQSYACSVVLALVCINLSFVGCNRKNKDASNLLAEAAAENKSAVCLVDGLAVRTSVGKNGKFLSSLALGEVVKASGESGKDEAGKEYLKVNLSDGKAGWVSAYGIVAGAQVGAATEDTPVFKRPDMITATSQKLPFMSIVAITQEKVGWLEVVGEGRKVQGWIQKRALTQAKEDVTVALLATKKLRAKDGLDQVAKLEEIIRTTPFPSSIFIQKLKQKSLEAAAPVPKPETAGSSWTDERDKETR